MLASIALGLVSLLPEEALFSWGWRLPFLASIILLAVGWYIRVKVPESPDFEKVKQQSEEVKVPALQVLKTIQSNSSPLFWLALPKMHGSILPQHLHWLIPLHNLESHAKTFYLLPFAVQPSFYL